MTGFFLFWLIFVNWVLVGAFRFMHSIPFDGQSHPIWFILVSGFLLFWLIFVSWALVGTFQFILVPFDGSFWSISFIYIHFSVFCVTVFTLFW